MAIQKIQQVSAKEYSVPTTGILELRPQITDGILKRVVLLTNDVVANEAIFDVNLGTAGSNLSTIFPIQANRVTIAAGQKRGSSAELSISVSAEEILTVDIDQASSPITRLTVIYYIEDRIASNFYGDVRGELQENLVKFLANRKIALTQPTFLSDEFNAPLDLAVWNPVSGTTVSGGQLVLSTLPSDFSDLFLQDTTIDLRGKQITFDIADFPTLGAGYIAFFNYSIVLTPASPYRHNFNFDFFARIVEIDVKTQGIELTRLFILDDTITKLRLRHDEDSQMLYFEYYKEGVWYIYLQVTTGNGDSLNGVEFNIGTSNSIANQDIGNFTFNSIKSNYILSDSVVEDKQLIYNNTTKQIEFKNEFKLSTQELQFSTSSLAANASENINTVVAKMLLCKEVTTNRAARIRAYSTSAFRLADASRPVGTETVNDNCLLEVVTTSLELTQTAKEVANLFNGDTPTNQTIYWSIQNLGTLGIVTLTAKILILEV